MRAAKIFMDATSDPLPITIKNQQNNYLQVNGVIITEEKIKNLPTDKLAKIQEIFATSHESGNCARICNDIVN